MTHAAMTHGPASRAPRRGRPSLTLAAVVAVVAVVGGAALAAADQQRARVAARDAAAAARAAVAADAVIRGRDIAFHAARAAGDPLGAADRARLAALYLQRAREEGDFSDYARAEAAARASLALRTRRNAAALDVLVAALLAQHRFADARASAQQLVDADPTVAAHRAVLGESCAELGDYACAADAFAGLHDAARTSLAVSVRLARWAELRGDTAQSRILLRRATTAAEARALPREARAWLHLRMGDLELRQGRARAAERELRAGLAVHPGDHRLLAAMARLAAARHAWRDAVRYGDSAVAVMPDPSTLGVLADAQAALGDRARAAEYALVMETAAGARPAAWHRAWSLYLLDHGRRAPEVLAAAQAEIVGGRHDVYGYDLLAWALHRLGRPAEARRAMAAALRLGTQDAMLLYHAGMIERAAGHPDAARAYLRRALAVAPLFDHAGPVAARATLDTLARQRHP